MTEPPPNKVRSWGHGLGRDRLLVSGFGRSGGGLYDLTNGAPVALDDIPTSGVGIGGDRLWRVLRAPAEQTAACELLCYDECGVRSYQRFDAIRDPHDVCWHDGAVHISSSWDSAVWRIERDATPEVAWWGGPVPDSWHINSLVVAEDRLHVCAFGRFDRYKAWKSNGGKASGFLLDTATGRDVLSGLAHPHSPHRVDDRWYVCESTRGELTEYALDGRVLRRVHVGRFTRGLAVAGTWAFVGGNSHRERDHDQAELVVVDRTTFAVAERIALPCSEVYDIVIVTPQLARAVAVGFGTNAARAVAQHRNTVGRKRPRSTTDGARVHLVTPRAASTLAAAGQRLDKRTAARCGVSGSLPTRTRAGDVLALAVTVENRSGIPLATVPPHPVRIGARWFPEPERHPRGVDAAPRGEAPVDDHDRRPPPSRDVLRNPLGPLPRLLHPDTSTSTEVTLEVPETPGRYHLRVAFHQAGTGWFGRRIEGSVTVVPRSHPAVVAGAMTS